MLDNTQSIICAFGLAAAAPRSPYRHLELCGIALIIICRTAVSFLEEWEMRAGRGFWAQKGGKRRERTRERGF